MSVNVKKVISHIKLLDLHFGYVDEMDYDIGMCRNNILAVLINLKSIHHYSKSLFSFTARFFTILGRGKVEISQ